MTTHIVVSQESQLAAFSAHFAREIERLGIKVESGAVAADKQSVVGGVSLSYLKMIMFSAEPFGPNDPDALYAAEAVAENLKYLLDESGKTTLVSRPIDDASPYLTHFGEFVCCRICSGGVHFAAVKVPAHKLVREDASPNEFFVDTFYLDYLFGLK